MRRDDAAAARAYFEEATKLDPSLAAPWANLGAIALSYRDYAAAESAYAQAIAAGGSRWDTHLAHAWALEGLRKPKDARAEFEKVLALKAGQEDALYGRAVALKAEGDLPAALEAFKAYALGPKASKLKDAQSQMASIELRLKNPPQAPRAAVKERAAAGSGDVDLSRLPIGTDTGPAATQLPTEAPPAPETAPQPAAPPKVKEKPGEKDPGLQKPAPGGTVQANVQR
jgi:tetratricopeptide (TPR) repeat protein